jgi:hypothetical protein
MPREVAFGNSLILPPVQFIDRPQERLGAAAGWPDARRCG